MAKCNEVLRLIEKRRSEIKGYGVKRIGIFGSCAKGTAKKASDVDIIVSFRKPTFDNYMGLKFMLEGALHRKVDIVIDSNIKPALAYVRDEAIYAEGM